MPGLRETVPGRSAGKLAVLQKETEIKEQIYEDLLLQLGMCQEGGNE